MIILDRPIKLDRFYLRHLTSADVTENYLSWFGDTTVKKFIDYAKYSREAEDLKIYIQEKNESESALFLGVFTTQGDLHIGNIKFEPIDLVLESAEMGILIGNKFWRGRGVGPEVILGVGSWLRDNLLIKIMTLGVSRENEIAISAYKKIGFSVTESADSGLGKHTYRMTLTLSGIGVDIENVRTPS